MGENFTIPAALDDDRHRVLGVAKVDQHAPVAPRALAFGALGKLAEQLFIVTRIAFGLAGKARRIDARCPGQGVYLQNRRPMPVVHSPDWLRAP